jgi:hypothetical protein
MADCAGSEPVGEMTLSTLNSLVVRSILLLSCKLKDPERPECEILQHVGTARQPAVFDGAVPKVSD